MSLRALLTSVLVLFVSLAVIAGELTGQESQSRDPIGETRCVTSPAGNVSIAYHVAGRSVRPRMDVRPDVEASPHLSLHPPRARP